MSDLMKIGIIGGGYVGKATSLLGGENIETFIHDVDPEKSNPVGTSLQKVSSCDLIFICVPTPMNEDDSCDTSIVESVISQLKELGTCNENIIVRSTVSVGTCKRLDVAFMPEFLTEATWKEDFINNEDWILGVNVGLTEPYTQEPVSLFKKLINLAFDDGKIKSKTIHCASTESVEMVKLVKNSFFAMKVSFFNEIYDFCKRKEVDFETVRHCVALDKRVGEGHTRVPGPDGKRGYGGSCLPKDTKSLLIQMYNAFMPSILLTATVKRNDTVDRTKYFDEQPIRFN